MLGKLLMASPCHQCGVLQCRTRFFLGHKSKHCPENLKFVGQEESAERNSEVPQYRTNIGNLVSLKCVDVSISVESINRDDNINDCEVNFNANISDNVINVFNGVSCVFPNDEFDLSYVGANGKTNDPFFDNIKESRLK